MNRFLDLAAVGAAIVLGLFLPAGCGPDSRPKAQVVEEARDMIARKLPPGWKAGYCRDVTFTIIKPYLADDIIIWKTEPLLLRQKFGTTQPATPAYVYFTMTSKDYVDPEAFKDMWRKQDLLAKEHARVDHSIQNVPRSTDGGFLPRGDEEPAMVASYLKAKAALPPYDPELLPTHHFEGIAFRLRDLRGQLQPDDHKMENEMNQAKVAVDVALKPYRPK